METKKNCVVTLPITPLKEHSIGLMVAPFVMDVISKKLNLYRVLALNVNGAKIHSQNVDEHVRGYIENNRILNIIPHFIWRDDQGENVFWVNKFFHDLRTGGHIVESEVELMKCSCGAVESLATAENISVARRLYQVRDGKKYCNLCESEVLNKKDVAFLFCLTFNFVSFLFQFFIRKIHNILIIDNLYS